MASMVSQDSRSSFRNNSCNLGQISSTETDSREIRSAFNNSIVSPIVGLVNGLISWTSKLQNSCNDSNSPSSEISGIPSHSTIDRTVFLQNLNSWVPSNAVRIFICAAPSLKNEQLGTSSPSMASKSCKKAVAVVELEVLLAKANGLLHSQQYLDSISQYLEG